MSVTFSAAVIAPVASPRLIGAEVEPARVEWLLDRIAGANQALAERGSRNRIGIAAQVDGRAVLLLDADTLCEAIGEPELDPAQLEAEQAELRAILRASREDAGKVAPQPAGA